MDGDIFSFNQGWMDVLSNVLVQKNIHSKVRIGVKCERNPG